MLQEKKSVSSRPLNIAAEKERLRREMEVAESKRNKAEVERIQGSLKELETISRKRKRDWTPRLLKSRWIILKQLPGFRKGYMGRKQRIEATIGRKVPENDGKRHAITLTVSDAEVFCEV
ncbi:hypothetical protein IFM89_022298 [Coptis chinensis]|uniref:Uncharacterized protein n=1 Tax=Coptis chinensis TaxID=261450 RepID=A0A835LZ54_9MAGN|nr:hypothetical protein IFM89_022298 [Coptis chinensis]